MTPRRLAAALRDPGRRPADRRRPIVAPRAPTPRVLHAPLPTMSAELRS